MNKNNEEEVRKRRCPFSREWCKVGECAIAIEIFNVRMGVPSKAVMCPFRAMIIILGEINQKTVAPQQRVQKIQLPGMHN